MSIGCNTFPNKCNDVSNDVFQISECFNIMRLRWFFDMATVQAHIEVEWRLYG